MTAPTYIHPFALDSQLRWIADKATRVCIVSDFARSDTFAQVSAKILCYKHFSTGALFGDEYDEYTSNGADTDAPNRVMDFLGGNSEPAILDNGTGSDTAVVTLDDSNNRIILATDDRGSRAIAIGEVVILYPFSFMSSQQRLI
jgi:hypothetical protein